MSNAIGMGHFARSISLATQLEKYGFELNLILENINTKTVSANIYKKIYSILNNDLVSFENILKSENFNNIYVVIDVLNDGYKYIDVCNKLKIRCLALDYFDHYNHYPSTIINLVNHNLNEEYNLKNNSFYFEGMDYAIIKTEFIEYVNKNHIKPISDFIQNVLITFGGSDPSNNSIVALDQLENYPSILNVSIIIGPFFSISHIEKLISYESKHNVTFHYDLKSLLILYCSCDLLFCGGGGTLLEALFLGIPTVVLPQNHRELRHANMYKNINACIVNDFELKELNNKLFRISLSKNARKAIDGKGVNRISEIILNDLMDSNVN